ncbi:MAG: TetR/AcrR family transcriptional regulator [Candidatus Omnitrophica bacterium]|nr:TetR/AcrR family transcriptional regulator [Candidatus Omnitrophota bacterium]
MVKTALDDSPTKTRLLDAAQELMLAKGFAATTVEAMCDAAKVTKGCFFHYFESKDQLGRELLERFCAEGARLHEACCGVDERDPLKRIYRYLDRMIKLSQDPVTGKGCLLGTFAQELSDVQPGMRKCCAEGFAAWAKQFGTLLAEAKAQHPPKTAFDPAELAEHFIAVMEGSLILGKARNNMKVVAQNIRHFKAYVRALFGR